MDRFDRIVPRLGNVLIIIAVLLILASALVNALNQESPSTSSEGAPSVDPQLTRAAQTLTDLPVAVAQASSLSGESMSYYTVEDGGYIFQTFPLAGDIQGYGGPMNLAVHIDQDGALLGFLLMDHRETPRWIRGIRSWMQTLQGKNLFDPAALRQVDTVSGATYSSRAIRDILAQAGIKFKAMLAGEAVATKRPTFQWKPEWPFVVMLLFTFAALYQRYYPNRQRRLAFLALVVVTLGLGLNAQFSTFHVFALLSGMLSVTGLSLMAYFLIVLPVVVILFGNLYCGYLCPFGALQELAWELWPRNPKPLDKRVWRYGRAVKYLILFVLVVLVVGLRYQQALRLDLLQVAFQRPQTPVVFGLIGILLALSMLSNRFWCRNLCPTGAFLSVLNRIRLFKRLRIIPHAGKCDLGVRRVYDADCICCDRCRHDTHRTAAQKSVLHANVKS